MSSIPDSLIPFWGEKFRGWHQTQNLSGTEDIILIPELPNLTYKLKIFDYQFKFIIPERVEFLKGITESGKVEYCAIKYNDSERLQGIFRYPLNEKGFFMEPLSPEEITKELKNISAENLKDLISRKQVLTFEAFRVPFFGFKYYLISEHNFKEIGKLAGEDVSSNIRGGYEKELKIRMKSVQEKIKSAPNYLLILQNILDLKLKDGKEISAMTDNIIHFGV
jgi:hypothetical protein